MKRPVQCLCLLYSIGVPEIKDADTAGAFYGTQVQSAVQSCNLLRTPQYSFPSNATLGWQRNSAPHIWGWDE